MTMRCNNRQSTPMDAKWRSNSRVEPMADRPENGAEDECLSGLVRLGYTKIFYQARRWGRFTHHEANFGQKARKTAYSRLFPLIPGYSRVSRTNFYEPVLATVSSSGLNRKSARSEKENSRTTFIVREVAKRMNGSGRRLFAA